MTTLEKIVAEVKPHWCDEDCRAWIAKYGEDVQASIDALLYEKLYHFSDFSYSKQITESKWATEIWVQAKELQETGWVGTVHYEEYLWDTEQVKTTEFTGKFPYGVIKGHIEGFEFEIGKDQIETFKKINIFNYPE